MSKIDKYPKPDRLIVFALLNAFFQFGVWSFLFALSIATFGFGSSPMVELTSDHPMSSLFPFVFRYPGFVLPILSTALIPARESRRWQVIALIAMLLSAGLMLLSVLLVDTAFFVPMVGYLVSAVLVMLVLAKRRGI